MITNHLKQKLRERALTCGSWVTFADEASAEILARSGFEWLVIDMEHTPLGMGEVGRLIRVIDLCGIPALCRLPSNDRTLIKKVLDVGASGIIVPMIETAEEALQAVESTYYPPTGKRGVGLWRAQGYGAEFESYKDVAQENLIVIAMIETAKGVENVDAVAATPGIDGVLIGPYDLSASLGHIGQLEHPHVQRAKQKIITATTKESIGCGLHIVHPNAERIEDALKQDFSFLVLGVDMIFLHQEAKRVLHFIKGRGE